MNISTKSTLSLLAITLLFTGCGTTTRLGQILIPAHPQSSARDGEEIRIVIDPPEPTGKLTMKKASGIHSEAFGSSAALAWLADQAIGQVAEEMRNEAKNYTQQYTGKLRCALVENTYSITMYRLIDKPPGTAAFDSTEFKLDDEITTMLACGKKKVASAYRFELKFIKGPDDNQRFGYLDLKEVYFRDAKAKIVGWNHRPWQFLGALLLKTGDKVAIDINVKMRGFGKDGACTILDTGYPSNGLTAPLSSKPVRLDSFKEGMGDWFVTGASIIENRTPFSMDIRVTERDPSNVQKILENGAKTVENNKANIVSHL